MVNRVPQTKGTNRATINRESRYYTHAEVNTQRHAEEKGFAPSTLRRSSPKAPRTFAKTHDSAAEHDGSEQRACRGAYAAVRHSFEKVGDHWEPKEANGPSDIHAERGGPQYPLPSEEAAGANAPKKHPPEVARRSDVHGRFTMTNSQLVDAIKEHSRRVRGR
jgi:hypothetical protein